MRKVQGVLLLSAGVLGGYLLRGPGALPVVHAQTPVYNPAVCQMSVPRSWGDYRGASEYGLAFQDNNGTLRFVQHPGCTNLPQSSVRAELEVKRQ
ncbi:MAG: hypothetical protein P4K83_00205 [Terracidiphilus sp.]|nr:hypothetical protein [Terracidiphilus sp.]